MPPKDAASKIILNSELKELPPKDIIVVGNVSRLHSITDFSQFTDNEDFCWSEGSVGKHSIALLGCKFSFWGDIAGALTTTLARLGHENVIYVGKLGGLQEQYEPNACLATGNVSFVNNEMVVWKNIFQDIEHPKVFHGKHITSFSILQETKSWLDAHRAFDFVDPEIGHMALCAKQAGIGASYLHVISNNLTAEHQQNLSNERLPLTRKNRDQMFNLVAKTIKETLMHESSNRKLKIRHRPRPLTTDLI